MYVFCGVTIIGPPCHSLGGEPNQLLVQPISTLVKIMLCIRLGSNILFREAEKNRFLVAGPPSGGGVKGRQLRRKSKINPRK